jgi:hypothetical protein
MTEMNEPVPAIIQQVDPAAVGADPQIAFLIFGYRSHPVATQTIGVGGLVPEAGEIVLCPVEPVQSIDRPDPQIMLLVFTDAPDIAIAEAGRVSRVIPVGDYFGAVITVQSVAGSKPDESLTILEYGFYGAVRKSLVIRKMRKCQFWRLGRESNCANKRRQTTDEIIFHDRQ